MTPPQKTALIAGATGLVGRECLRLLCASSIYDKVVVVTRRDLTGEFEHPKIRQLVVDFRHLVDHADQLVADHVFCALGTTMKKAGSKKRFREIDFRYPQTLAELTRDNGARHFSLVTAKGANPTSLFFYSRIKGELEFAQMALVWPSLVILRPSVIGGDRAESRPAERLAQRLLAIAPKSIRTVPALAIAKKMVEMAQKEPPGLTVVESTDLH